ncbi:MAG: hypothetical protein HQL08_14295 [Nitrospirae bacterium]|nr:hypothetical protein [Nitrospirota bacterium]
MDEDTLKGNTRAKWGQLTDYDLPVTEGTDNDLTDFYKNRYRYEKNIPENI